MQNWHLAFARFVNPEDLYQKLLDACFRFLSFRPRSRAEVESFLLKKKSLTSLTSRILTRLTELGYINDEKFAKWWINQRQTHKPKGIRLIVQELKAKGIEWEMESKDENEQALRAIARKLPLWQKLPELTRKKKIYDFLTRRGFSSDITYRVIDEVVKKRYNKDIEEFV